MSAKSKKRRGAAAAAEPAAQSSPWFRTFLEQRAGAVALALVLLATIRIAATYTVFTHTYDEPSHIACGMEWLDHGRYQYEAQHPPLARVAAALGPYLLGARGQNTPRNTRDAIMVEGLRILYSGDYDKLLAAARAGILPFFWVACAVVWWWAARYFGRLEALAAVFLFSFLEPVLAHAGLATTDMALTAFLGAAFLTGTIWLEDPTPRRAALFGLCAGLAVVSKYSSLAFFPAAAVVALGWHWTFERPKAGELREGALRRLPGLALAAAIVCVIVMVAFRFSWGDSGLGLKLPAPEFFQGIRDVAKHNAEGHPGYLLGQRSKTGFWYFYAVVLAVKTPLAFLFLAVIGMRLVFRRSSGYRFGWLPVAYAAGILVVALFSHINIGVRHILPVYTGLSLVAGAGAVHLWRSASEHAWTKYALPAALLWFGATSLAAHPDYLPYFNELAGSHPENILVDSDLDWGQDYKRLAARLQELGARQVTFTPFPMTVLARHGFPLLAPLNPFAPMGGWDAIGVSTWKERRLGVNDKRVETDPWWADQYEPTEKVGKTIYLWDFPGPGSKVPWPKPRQ
jgi:Dolichyl-phosphate-mannose-protein mannosyltransferase